LRQKSKLNPPGFAAWRAKMALAIMIAMGSKEKAAAACAGRVMELAIEADRLRGHAGFPAADQAFAMQRLIPLIHSGFWPPDFSTPDKQGGE
jgi:hypothetical protein